MHPNAGRAHPDLNDLYRKLEAGIGHELVTDRNVAGLIEIAALDGNATLETILREWQAACSDGSPGVPSTIAPTPGFNRLNAKH